MEHRAHCEQQPDGKWSGGCELCGTSFCDAEKLGAESWVSGHDSAIACTRRAAEKVGPRFTKVGPGEAPTLYGLRTLLAALEERFVGAHVEILQPADHIPALFLWTPPTKEGWNREYLGAIYLHGDSYFLLAPREDATAAG